MTNMVTRVLGLAACLASLAAAHSHIDYLIIDGAQYPGFNPHTYANNTANIVGWTTTVPDDGFVPPSNYSSSDIICHRNGAPVPAHAPVRAGDRIFIQWNGWPLSHAGPALSYLATCGDREDGCASVDKESLRFFKIDDSRPGFINETGGIPGQWTSDIIIAANNSWTIEIPPTLAPGAYVLRHELIALHFAYQDNGAQNYPQCVNLWVLPSKAPAIKATGTTKAAASLLTLNPSDGVAAPDMYHSEDPGIAINIYETLTTYVIPGPTVIPQAVEIGYSAQSSMMAAIAGTPVLVTATSMTTPAPTAPFTEVPSVDPGPYRRREVEWEA